MIQLGERFLYGFEIAGACIIGLIFIGMALTSDPDTAWKLVIAAVLCFSIALFFGVMYLTNKKEREKRQVKM